MRGDILSDDHHDPEGPREDAGGLDVPALEAVVGHRFRDPELLVTALTHRSYAHESREGVCDNESFEFLGDAVLAFDVADRLYRSFPGLDEGRLSKHKHVLVRSSTLAEAGRRLGLGMHLRLGRGERMSRNGNDKILSNTFEAVVAAVFLDGGLEPARAFIGRALRPHLDSLVADSPVSDYKSVLQELTQARGLGTPHYDVVEESGPDHLKQFRVSVSVAGEVLGEGSGATKRKAHQFAAQLALEHLQRQPR